MKKMKYGSIFCTAESLICILILLINTKSYNSSHFRGGSISVKAVHESNTSVILEFSTQFSWRRDFDDTTFCDDLMIKDNKRFGPDLNIVCQEGCNKPNEVVGNTSIICTAYSINDNWSFGQSEFQYTLPKNRQIKVSFFGSFWIDLVTGGSTAYWEIKTSFSTFARSDTNKINSSPKTLIAPVIRVRSDMAQSILIPTIDSDNDEVRCRWSDPTKNECANICKLLPNSVLDSDCRLNFDPRTLKTGWYAVAIQIEDFINQTDTTPLSSVPIQFLINVLEVNKNCADLPSINATRPFDSCFSLTVGDTLEEKLFAKANCENETITDIQILGPIGSFSSSILKYDDENKYWYSTIIWKPTYDQQGPNLICAQAVDSSLLKSNLSCFTIIVGNESLSVNSFKPSGQIEFDDYKNQTFLYFYIEFNSLKISLSNKSAFIRVFSFSNDTEILKIDSSKSNSVYAKDSTLVFKINLDLISTNEWYYVNLDHGVVLAGDVCEQFSNQVKDKNSFKFFLHKNATDSSNQKDVANCNNKSLMIIIFLLLFGFVYLNVTLLVLTIFHARKYKNTNKN